MRKNRYCTGSKKRIAINMVEKFNERKNKEPIRSNFHEKGLRKFL